MSLWNFDFLNPKKHWHNGVGWEINNTYQIKVIKVIKLVVQHPNFVFLTCDEVTTMDNTSLASVHGYIV
jgi:hypothetical protein